VLCPSRHVTPWVHAVCDLLYASKHLRTPPLEGPVILWPGKVRDALLLLETEGSALSRHLADEARRKREMQTAFTRKR
jgi:hypothetical protein